MQTDNRKQILRQAFQTNLPTCPQVAEKPTSQQLQFQDNIFQVPFRGVFLIPENRYGHPTPPCPQEDTERRLFPGPVWAANTIMVLSKFAVHLRTSKYMMPYMSRNSFYIL